MIEQRQQERDQRTSYLKNKEQQRAKYSSTQFKQNYIEANLNALSYRKYEKTRVMEEGLTAENAQFEEQKNLM